MSLKIVLNLFVDHPCVAISALLIGGGILFGLIGGLTGIEFFKTRWFVLLWIGIVIFFICIFLEIVSRRGGCY